ncbi:LPXTG cell wall anchor domain-containing protein [Streptomyces sp. NPDC050211]|uniref:LPXTG cell wall anchor domain-containing protein n=1 Tax=Streptomyces sp. NPDC050211 TaxID=3154932 RepID=UPI003419B84B
MPTPSLSVVSRALVALPAAAVLLLAAGTAPAVATDDTYTVQLRQELPRTATSASGGVPQKDNNQCPGISTAQDGWHFVLPGDASHFVKLTVAFEPGGQKVVTDFGPPSDKHAYVASLPGAQLTSAVAEVTGGELELFNLSHTCPAAAPAPSESEQPTQQPGDEPCEEATSENSGMPCEEAVPAASGEPCDEAASDTTGSTPCAEASGTPSDDKSAQPTAAASPNGGDSGDLAETGAGPTIGLTAAALLLLTAGGYLVLRRRKTAAQQD